MASADYRLCDQCGHKAFYDSNLNYNFDAIESERIKDSHYGLDYLGDWAVLCHKCAKEYECQIVKKQPTPTPTEGT